MEDLSSSKKARFFVEPSEAPEDEEENESGPLGELAFNPTYATQYFKSFRQYLTRDALPSENHYRNLLSFTAGSGGNLPRKFSRPTLEELQEVGPENGKLLSDTPEENRNGEVQVLKGKVVKFGWIEGVFMRCLLNIWGVMLFLRLTWVVGQAGLVQGLLVITLCNLVTFLTALSMSAVSTNGQIKGGGIYYMISRSLGPEFGGAIGIMFTIANSIAVSMYLIGFCDSLFDMMDQYVFDFKDLIGLDRINFIRVIGTGSLVLVLALAIVGMDWVTRVQIILLFLLIGSQLDFLIGSVVGSLIPDPEEAKYGFTGFNWETIKNNVVSNYHNHQNPEQAPSFFKIFGVFFPAVTGIVAGANLSGDLKNPAVSIPKGTLLAILTTYISYISYGFIVGATYLSEASGNLTEYINWLNQSSEGIYYNDCSNEHRVNDPCLFGSSNDQQTMEKISFTGYLIYAGCFAATLSSAIASLVGAPRVLQALAKDKLYPYIEFFSVGYGANNDPFRGYILVFFISLACLLIGQLDAVSSLLSNFFVAAYALINFSVFHASLSKSPGWRPSFKYYNRWVALFGTILCLAVMFLMDWIAAIITFVIIIGLYLFIWYRKPEANWGSSTQAQQFISTLKSVQSLNETSDHVKNYRPKILVFTGIPSHRPPLIDFANLITKKLSLLQCAHIIKDGHIKELTGFKGSVQNWLKDHNIKAFYSVTQNSSFEEGAIACMNLAGLGKLSPNMVLFGYKRDWITDTEGLEGYIGAIHYAFDSTMSVGILRLETGCDFSAVIGEEASSSCTEPELSEKGETCIVESSEVKKVRKTSTAIYHDTEGNPLAKCIVANILQFQSKKRRGDIDVWWLYDDGGLTLLLPYILSTRSQFSECKLRVFALANRKDELDKETRNMASLLAKFRIDYSDVTVIPDITKKAEGATKAEFNELISKIKPPLNETEILSQKEKTNRHLRLAELLRDYSKKSEMIFMTLTMPRRGTSSAQLYMSWIEIMTRNMPPVLLIRGNQNSVLTFYS